MESEEGKKAPVGRQRGAGNKPPPRLKPVTEPTGGRPRMHWLLNLAITVAIAIALALLSQAFLVKPFKVPSGSMEPTLAIGQRVLVDRISERFGNPSVGNIVVFWAPQGAIDQNPLCGAAQPNGAACDQPTSKKSNQYFIKRLVAGPGDRFKMIGGHVYRNGVREKDSYIRACGPGSKCDFPTEITIPKGYFYMIGDNRGNSLDSRFWGPVPKKWIVGEAFFTYWPISRIGTL